MKSKKFALQDADMVDDTLQLREPEDLRPIDKEWYADTDRFDPVTVLLRVSMALDRANSRSESNVSAGATTAGSESNDVLVELFGSSDGFAKLRTFVWPWVERCIAALDRLIARTSEANDQRNCLAADTTEASSAPQRLRSRLEGQRRVLLSDFEFWHGTSGMEPLLELSHQLLLVDGILVQLASRPVASDEAPQSQLDAAALAETMLNLGMAIGTSRTLMKHHVAIIKDEVNRSSYRRRGLKAAAPKPFHDVALISQVFDDLDHKKSMRAACLRACQTMSETIGSRSRRSLSGTSSDDQEDNSVPHWATIRRMVLREVKNLLAEVDQRMESSSLTIDEACDAVAESALDRRIRVSSGRIKAMYEAHPPKSIHYPLDPELEFYVQRLWKVSDECFEQAFQSYAQPKKSHHAHS